MRGAAGAGHDDPSAGQRAAHGQFDAGAEAGRVGVEAHQLAGRRPGHAVDRADGRRVGLDAVAQAGHEALVWRRHLEAQPARAARLGHGRRHGRLVQLQELVAGVDPGRRERGVMHDLRVAPPEGLAQERDPLRHRRAGAIRRTGPAVAGNVTWGMISSTHARSCAGSGVMVWRTKYSTPASTRACSEAMTSSGVPNR